MIQLITTYVCASLAVMSMIVFIELLVNFKRPLNLKIALLSFSFSVIVYSLGIIYCHYTSYNRWIIEFPSIFVTATGLCFFSILYLQKIKNYVFLFSALMILTQLFFFLYFSYIKPISVNINLGGIKYLFYTRVLIRAIFTIGSVWLIVVFYRKILIKYDTDNIYYKHLKQWSFILLLCINPVCIANFIKITNLTSASIEQILRLSGYFGCVLCFLFRPKFLNQISLNLYLFDKPEKHLDVDFQISLTSFENLFFNSLYYLNKEAPIELLSKELKVSREVLNDFIIKNYSINFIDLVNKNRTTYFVDLIISGKFKDITIDALAQQAGFGTRQHLYKHFKRFHGGTPSDLLKAVN